jgi:hypothetical protein
MTVRKQVSKLGSRGNAMKKDFTTFVLAWALVLSVQAIAQQANDGAVSATLAAPSAFLPSPGQTLSYRFSDTLITPKETKSEAGTLTLTAVTGNEIKATVAIDNKAPRSFSLHEDQTGALQASTPPSATPRHSRQSAPGDAEQALLLRLSLAAQIGARPGEEMSIPVLLNVPWASSPVNPTLYVKPTTEDAFTADATDSTTINPPQKGRPHILRSVAISAGAGILAGQIGGTAGSVIRPIVTVGSILIASRSRSGPQPTEVTLHITGQLADGRLQRLSGNQKYSVAQKEHSRISSENWQLLAQSAPQKADL